MIWKDLPFIYVLAYRPSLHRRPRHLRLMLVNDT